MSTRIASPAFSEAARLDRPAGHGDAAFADGALEERARIILKRQAEELVEPEPLVLRSGRQLLDDHLGRLAHAAILRAGSRRVKKPGIVKRAATY